MFKELERIVEKLKLTTGGKLKNAAAALFQFFTFSLLTFNFVDIVKN